MVTANERLHDALVRRQIYLSRYSNGLQRQINTLLDRTEADVRAQIERAVDPLMSPTGHGVYGEDTRARLKVLAQTLKQTRAKAFDRVNEMWDSQMQALAVSESDYLDAHLNDVSPVVLDTVLPDPVMLAAIANTTPMQGRLMSDWADSLQEADAARIMDAINVGMVQGKTTDGIIQDVLGTSVLDGVDGVTQTTRANAASITQTAIATTADQARSAYYQANDDIIKQEVWVAVLDSRTTPECSALDGTRFPVGQGPRPPLHWNCRSTRVAILNGNVIGDRPYTTATEDQLAGLSGDERAAKVAELTGQVPASVDYQEWLARQSPEFQDEVLGPGKAQMFRDGATLKSFVNNGQAMTLDQITAQAAKTAAIPTGDAALAAERQWISDSPIHTVEALYTDATENDALLKETVAGIADDQGLSFVPGPIKKEARVLEKLTHGKGLPSEITDVVRGSVVVDTPEEADAFVKALSKELDIADEGWRVTPAGYFDRPIKVLFENGQIGEILVGPQVLFAAKHNVGHGLYDLYRVLADSKSPEARALQQQMLELYGKAADSLPGMWDKLLNWIGAPEG